MLTEQEFFLQPIGLSNRINVNREVYSFPTFKAGVPEAGTYYVNLTGLIKPGVLNVGLGIQCSAAVNVSFTFENAATVRLTDGAAIWTSPMAIAANEFNAVVDANGNAVFGNVMRIVTTVPCTFFLGAL